MMRAIWYKADFGDLPRGVVVADASAAAAAFWPGPILSVLEELAEALPADRYPDVCFLGARRCHPLPDVLRGLGFDKAGGHRAARARHSATRKQSDTRSGPGFRIANLPWPGVGRVCRLQIIGDALSAKGRSDPD